MLKIMLKITLILASTLCLTSCSMGKEKQPQPIKAAGHAPTHNVIYLTSASEFASIIQTGNVIVDFYADWCGPCKNLAQSIQQVAVANPRVKFLKINIDTFPGIASQYSVRSIPALYFFKDGNKVKQTVGYKSTADLGTLVTSVYQA